MPDLNIVKSGILTQLINLPIPFVEDDERQPPGGLVSIATYARLKGCRVKVLDLSGVSEDSIIDKIEYADVFGIGTYSATYSLAVRVAKQIKNKFPSSIIVAGGPHASALPEEVAQDFDVAMVGEGEFEWVNIIKALEQGKKLPKIIRAELIKNLDDLPFPDYEYFCDMKKYTRKIHNESVMCLDSSRGCNFKCRFCNSTVSPRGYWRAKSAEKVYEEIKWHVEQGWKAFRFNDDNFLTDKERAKKICELIKPLNIKWRIFARAESLSSDMCACLVDAGCSHISVGIESLSPLMLKLMGKGTSVERIKIGLHNARMAGIATRGFFIVGFPGETDFTIAETIKNIKGLELDEATVYPCLAYPGTDLYHRPEHYGIVWIEDDFSKYIQVGKEKSTGYVIQTKSFGAKEMQRWRSKVMNALEENSISWCDEKKDVV